MRAPYDNVRNIADKLKPTLQKEVCAKLWNEGLSKYVGENEELHRQIVSKIHISLFKQLLSISRLTDCTL